MFRGGRILTMAQMQVKTNKLERIDDVHWREASRARDKGQAKFLEGPNAKTRYVCFDQAAEDALGEWYSGWSAQTASCMATANGYDGTSTVTRGAWMISGHGPLFGRRRGLSDVPYAVVHDPIVVLWSGAANQMKLICKHIERKNSTKELHAAAQWLVKHILPVIRDIWQPRRAKEWRPGARGSGVTYNGNASLSKLL